MRRFILPVFLTGILLIGGAIILAGCSKEGPAGANGTNGTDGVDANQTCKLCHSATVVDRIATEFELSKHSWGEAAFEEAGNTGCAPCHEQEGFKYVCANNVPATITLDPGTGKYVNNYNSIASAAIGEISCYTCHSQLHTTYGYSDVTTFTNTAAVSMTMWGGAKTINLTQDGGKSNLCVKCHQPRPLTCSASNSRLMPYDTLKNFPNLIFWDSTDGFVAPYVKPSYRTHNHYGVVGAVFAGVGAIEFPGTLTYENSPHTTVASCQDCHMASPMTGMAGGHAFNMRNAKESAFSSSTTWNFNGCNTASETSACHSATPLSATSTKFATTRSDVKALLDALATKINAVGAGHDILHKDASSTNLWWGITTNNYDGYLDIYSSSSNPSGYWRDPSSTSGTNMAKPKFPSLTNAYFGAIINFQFCLREYSLGIHNTAYVTALLTNTIAILP
jgi:hypothetical protein